MPLHEQLLSKTTVFWKLTCCMVQIQQYFRETLLGSPTMQLQATGYTKRLTTVYHSITF